MLATLNIDQEDEKLPLTSPSIEKIKLEALGVTTIEVPTSDSPTEVTTMTSPDIAIPIATQNVPNYTNLPSEDRERRPSSSASSLTQRIYNEPHFEGAEVVRDVIIGLSDGLTVPFALAAGLSALSDSRIVVIAGIAGWPNCFF